MEDLLEAGQTTRDAFTNWEKEIKKNIYTTDLDFIHTIKFTFPNHFSTVNSELEKFGDEVVNQLEPLVNENNLANHLPQLKQYNFIGDRIDQVSHHPTYVQAGDIIYKSRLLEKILKPGGLTECLSLLFLSSQAGEAGHNCPIACSAGIIRVLLQVQDFPQKKFYLDKLTAPSYQTNFTGAQFLTEIQGGSDVGLNTTYARKDKENKWRIYGEKWFCSNAGANLIFLTARYNDLPGTKGLALFLVPAEWEKKKNHYIIRRLKEKIGTRSMATGEIDFQGAYAIPIEPLAEGFHLIMDNVLHLSRLFNTFCVLGMARRAYTIARNYAKHRVVFSHPIYDYPLVKETLAKIKAENSAMLAAAFLTAKLQDDFDQAATRDQNIKLLLRFLVNAQKYFSALLSVEHIHLALGVLAGNGAIETFSPIPRLLRDCIVCENWEGAHNVLRMQILKDILKYDIDKIYLAYMRGELNKITDERPKKLETRLQKLEAHLNEFRKLDKELQTLQIRIIVDQMVILFCALSLLKEGLDQHAASKSDSKLRSYDYFLNLMVNTDLSKFQKENLAQISKIIE